MGIVLIMWILNTGVVMSETVKQMKCPGCGAIVAINQKECEWCHNPILISSFNSVYTMTGLDLKKYEKSYQEAMNQNPDVPELNKSMGICYLKLRLYEKALSAFEKAIEDNFDDSETYYYAALSLLNGKKAFNAPRKSIDQAIEYLEAAIQIEPRGIYYYALSYLKYDYFERKFLRSVPNYVECFNMAVEAGTSQADVGMMYEILGVERPSKL